MTAPLGIRLGPPPEASAPSPGVRFVIPLRRASTGTPATTTTGSSTPRPSLNVERVALAVAAAVDEPADALYLVRQARNKPDKALGQPFDKAKVAEILAEIKAAQENPSKEFDITPPIRAAAAAAGANARLVAAACELLSATHSAAPADPDPAKNSLGWNGRRWAINLVDPPLIDRAVRAFLRAHALEVLTAGEDLRNLQRAVEKIVTQVSKLESTDAKVLEDLKVIQAKVDGVGAGGIGAGGAGAGGAGVGGAGGGVAGGGGGGGAAGGAMADAGAGAGPGEGVGAPGLAGGKQKR